MGLTSQTHLNHCSIKNALLWGMCRSHIHHVRMKSQRNHRITHLVLAILEAIPLIGQIISLIERKIVLKHSLANQASAPKPIAIPKPVKQAEPIAVVPQVQKRPAAEPCLPSFDKESIQENPDDICRVWPKDLQRLGVTDEQKNNIDVHVRDAMRALHQGGEIEFPKKTLKYTDGNHPVNAPLPLSLIIFKDQMENGSFQVILLPKTVFAEAGERKIRFAYDLTKGDYLLKKRVVGPFEQNLVKALVQKREERGIRSTIYWRKVEGKNRKLKVQALENVRHGTIASLFEKAPLADFSVKRDLILDLLTDLHDLHQLILNNVLIPSAQPRYLNQNEPERINYSAFHADIKVGNVLTTFQGKWRAELIDLGLAAANPTARVISVGYTPPEFMRHYLKLFPLGIKSNGFDREKDNIEFNLQYGQRRDIWCLGLVILALLVEREHVVFYQKRIENVRYRATIPPLDCLKKIIPHQFIGDYEEKGIVDLKQDTLDADLDTLEIEVIRKHPQEREGVVNIFNMLKDKMLRINPDERKTVAECRACV